MKAVASLALILTIAMVVPGCCRGGAGASGPGGVPPAGAQVASSPGNPGGPVALPPAPAASRGSAQREPVVLTSEFQDLLRMSQEQREKMEALARGSVKDDILRQANLDMLSAELTILLMEPKPDAAAVAAKLAQAQKIKADLEAENYRLLVEAKGSLTAEQIRIFDDLLAADPTGLFEEKGGGSPAQGGGAPQGQGQDGMNAGGPAAPQGDGGRQAGGPAGGMQMGGMQMGGMQQGGMQQGGMQQGGMQQGGMQQGGMQQGGMQMGGMQQGALLAGGASAGGAVLAAGVDGANLPPCEGQPGPCQAACAIGAGGKAAKK